MSITLYISGPMTGIKDDNFPAFKRAKDQLLHAGYTVISPADNLPAHGAAREHYMRLDYMHVLYADGIALLPGCAASPGAQSEIRQAIDMGLPVAPVEWWFNILGASTYLPPNWRHFYKPSADLVNKGGAH